MIFRFFKIKYSICIVFILIVVSCKTHKQIAKDNDPTSTTSADSIVFINLQFKNDTIQKQTIVTILNTTKVAGTLKKNERDLLHCSNYLTWIFINNKLKIYDTIQMEHPLYKEVEYVTENNEFTKKDIQLYEADFTLRFQKNNCSSIELMETTATSRNKQLIQVKL